MIKNKTIFLQWLIKEKDYKIEIFSHIENEDDLTFVAFESGDRCNIDLINDINENNPNCIMAFIENPNKSWDVKTKEVGGQKEEQRQAQDGKMYVVQPYIPGKIVYEVIPPSKSHIKPFKPQLLNDPVEELNENLNELIIDQSIEENIEIQKPINKPNPSINSNNPVHILIQTSKKEESIINLELNMEIPTKEIYKIVSENFSNGKEDFINYIINDLDISIIKDSLKEGLKSFYENEAQNNLD